MGGGDSLRSEMSERREALKDWLSGRIDGDLKVAAMHYALVAANRAALSKMRELEAE